MTIQITYDAEDTNQIKNIGNIFEPRKDIRESCIKEVMGNIVGEKFKVKSVKMIDSGNWFVTYEYDLEST